MPAIQFHPEVGEFRRLPVAAEMDGIVLWPGVTWALVGEALRGAKQYSLGRICYLTVDLERPIGNAHCVETTEADEVFFARHGDGQRLARFVRGRQPEQTSRLSLTLRVEREVCLLDAAYFGVRMLPTPRWVQSLDSGASWDVSPADMDRFWRHHALVEGVVTHHVETEQSDWPWPDVNKPLF